MRRRVATRMVALVGVALLVGVPVGYAATRLVTTDTAPPSVGADGAPITLSPLNNTGVPPQNPATSSASVTATATSIALSDGAVKGLFDSKTRLASATTGLVDEGSGLHHWVSLIYALVKPTDVNAMLPYHYVGAKTGKLYAGLTRVRATNVTSLLLVVDIDSKPAQLIQAIVDPQDIGATVVEDAPPIPADEYPNG